MTERFFIHVGGALIGKGFASKEDAEQQKKLIAQCLEADVAQGLQVSNAAELVDMLGLEGKQAEIFSKTLEKL